MGVAPPARTDPPPSPAWPWAVGGVLLAAWALASHWLMVHAAGRPWALAALFGPLLLAAAVAGVRQRHAGLLAGCALGAAAVGAAWARGSAVEIERLLVLQHAAVHAALALAFAVTLRDGATPLITALARSVHRLFTPAMARYTRRLTAVWAGYFVAMIALSVALYAAAPWPWWSLFGNVLTPLAALALFVGEHALRYRRHPEFERLTLRDAAAAWQRLRAAR